MADPKKLVEMLKSLEDQLVTCMRCGMCQAQCPVFAQSGREGDVTRGKIALLAGLAEEMIKDPEGVNNKLNRCLLCGTCEANCPSGVKVTDIFLRARAIMAAYNGMSPTQKLIFQQLLTHPGLFNTILDLGAKFQGIFTKPVNDMLGTSCARFNAPIIGDRHFKTLAAKPLHSDVPSLDTPAGASNLRVAFYPGCVVDKIYPSVGHAVLKVLKHHGVGVFMPKGQACCGIPAISNGDVASFQKMVKANIELFRKGDFDYLITPCATCTSTIKKIWPAYYEDKSDQITLAKIVDKVKDVSAFLVDVLKVSPMDTEGTKTVTYHDPCHLRNSLGVTAQPRTLLKATPGVKFVEMTDAASCCGSGGSFNLKFYELSQEIGRKKAQHIIDSQAETVATGCPACMMQMTDMLSKAGASRKVRHVVELYADTL
ncbi:(Fe-S)-binding protein [Megalodesulfovibrio gigas]|uniref:Glycolate oxidase iron-sulfur subunit n=1 Tax=Megalodesulfovibrio gigas (strain ATCC 19364 / DSM 1382 / NCIMB 9332 / VKM B-1759) TaxID=1121448 RepID=T2GAW4_MEGG1|nr:(Fe-S)-binding protein [Megalodesulfovibrio gigas]AGW13266.1 putative protein of unknown function DUF224 cysteine-rich region domain protein [Megalodesulfovibrio gigas DSM 1382 = ATCC 19364]